MAYPVAVRKAARVGRRMWAVAHPPHPNPAVPPWSPTPDLRRLSGAYCNVCRWRGREFERPGHVELTHCPRCGSNGRDRFLHWCLAERVGLHRGLRVVECSPRLGPAYRNAMAAWFSYQTSDYDMRSHAGNLRIDLQAIDLPDASLDVVLCAHVLEHVRDTGRALAELHRVLAPGGHLLLQVPVLQARTAPPVGPEFHEDDTPVFWRFGFDLTAPLRAAGFHVDLLCTAAFDSAVYADDNPWPTWAAPFDVPDILAGVIPEDLTVIADGHQATRLGIEPAYQYLAWDCTRP
ncbi:MAG TPA: class I SAM-dependent methyltransferase [Acidimicrobiales bacterium]|nr:class I SAM-dependent methyltransferase [Acidimicrobiales bacterium]